MLAEERRKRIAEIETVVSVLQEKGWRVEQVQHTDIPDEPFKTEFTLSCASDTDRAGIL